MLPEGREVSLPFDEKSIVQLRLGSYLDTNSTACVAQDPPRGGVRS